MGKPEPRPTLRVASPAPTRSAGLARGRPPKPEPVGFLPAAVALLGMILVGSAFLGFGLYFIDETEALPAAGSALAWTLLIGIMTFLTMRISRAEEREVEACGRWQRAWQVLAPITTFTWKFVVVALLILLVARLVH